MSSLANARHLRLAREALKATCTRLLNAENRTTMSDETREATRTLRLLLETYRGDISRLETSATQHFEAMCAARRTGRAA